MLAVTESVAVVVPSVIGCLFAAGLIWMALLRPSVTVVGSELHLRTMFEAIRIPLASIDTVMVRRYLLVRSGGQRYICPAISRPLRKTLRAELNWSGQSALQPGLSLDRLDQATGKSLQTEVKGDQDLAFADFVEQRIAALAADDRAARGIEERSEEEYELGSQAVRRTAWPEIAALTALAVATLLRGVL